MRGAPETMTYLRPRTAAEALAELANSPGAAPLAGGTDFMVGWNMGLLNGKTVVDLSGIAAWKAIRRIGARVEVGALATHAELQRDAAIRRHFPLLVQACATVGGAQIQNRGTIGGNIANASPAGDTFPPLAVYDAAVRVASSERPRTVPFLDVFAGVKRTTLRPGELIESIGLALPSRKPDRRLFRKVGTRAAQAISKTVAAGLLWLGRGGIVEELRFALGSMAPTVRRLKTVEAFVRGKKLAPNVAREAAELLERDVSPIDDIRSTRRYRLEVSKNLLRSFLSV